MVCGPGEADRYLKGSLDEFARLCDDAVIVGNNTDEKTEALIKSYGYWFYRDDREWGVHQPDIKTDLLRRIATLVPDIVLPLDSDEQYDSAFTRAEAEAWGMKYPACYFHIENMWNDARHYRKSMGFWNIRMFQFKPELGLQYARKRVHCGLGPPWTYIYGAYIPFIVKHYGLMDPADRMAKVERYRKYDPRAVFKGREYYDALAEQVEGSAFDELEAHNRVAAEVATYGDQHKTIQSMATDERYVYIRRMSDGRVVDMTENEWNAMSPSRKKEFEFLEFADTPGEPNYVQPPTPAAIPVIFQCPICAKEVKTAAAFARHKKSHQ